MLHLILYLNNNIIDEWVSNYIRTIFCHDCHWITASTVGCKEGDINIFDSFYCKIDLATKKAIADVYPGSDISFNVPGVVPWQLGADDCGQ